MPKQFTVAVVDDEHLARKRLLALLEADSSVCETHECNDVDCAIDVISNQKPDIVLLDIQLRDESGFEIIRRIGVNAMPTVMFVTAFDNHALNAFEVHAVDYLLKPFDDKRFATAFDKAKRNAAIRAAPQLEKLLQSLLQETHVNLRTKRKKHAIRAGAKTLLVDSNEILWIEARGVYTKYHLVRGNTILARQSLKTLELALSDENFIRIHRSYIINLAHVESFTREGRSSYVSLQGGIDLVIGEQYLSKFKRAIGFARDND